MDRRPAADNREDISWGRLLSYSIQVEGDSFTGRASTRPGRLLDSVIAQEEARACVKTITVTGRQTFVRDSGA